MTGNILPIGIGTASLYPRLATAGSAVDTLTDPGDTNPPIIFEPPIALSGGAYEVWLIASGGPDWGGCQVWLSIDNATYALAGTIYRGARQGTLTADLPSHPDPDVTSTLSVDLTQSQGQLLSGTQADADNFVTLCYVDGELISYRTATLTAAHGYDLTYLRRGVYGTAINAHAIGSSFARFGPSDPSLFRYRYPGNFVGQTIHVKLPAFNIFGQALQDLSELAADTYTLTGAGAVAAVTIPIQFLGAPQAGQPITRYTCGQVLSLPADLAGSVCSVGMPAAVAQIHDVARNGTNFATITFAPGESQASFAGSTQSFVSGDVMTITPRATDANLAQISGYLAGSG
ncbi:MAG: hypothetical protein AB7H90_11390 [Alphaproteobacteria bacterium]